MTRSDLKKDLGSEVCVQGKVMATKDSSVWLEVVVCPAVSVCVRIQRPWPNQCGSVSMGLLRLPFSITWAPCGRGPMCYKTAPLAGVKNHSPFPKQISKQTNKTKIKVQG